MNVYSLMRIFGRIRSRRLRLAGIMTLHTLRRRYIGVYLDPVMACNIRCRMCYMSDPDKRRSYRGERLTPAMLDTVERSLLPRALKLQIGCATEPTLDADLAGIIARGRRAGVPYISITTNGQRVTPDDLESWISAGLDEITLSVHSLRAESYEYLMTGARFERFEALIEALRQAKRRHPAFKIRLNYVINSMNLPDLADFFTGVLAGLDFDVVQLRPFQDVGDTSYSDHNLGSLIDRYDEIIAPIIERCRAEGRVCIAPTKQNILALDGHTDSFSDYIEELTYYYVGASSEPGRFSSSHPAYDMAAESFAAYHRRSHTLRGMLRRLWRPNVRRTEVTSTKKMNYTVN